MSSLQDALRKAAGIKTPEKYQDELERKAAMLREKLSGGNEVRVTSLFKEDKKKRSEPSMEA